MYRQGVDVAEGRGPYAQLERVEEREGRLPVPRRQLEGDEPPRVREEAAGHLVVGVIFEARMVNLRDLRVRGEAGGDLARVLALAGQPERQGLEAAVREPGLEGSQGPADELADRVERPVVGRPRDDGPGGQVAVA